MGKEEEQGGEDLSKHLPRGPESFFEKLKRKSMADPLVPIGSLVTLGVLLTGFNAFVRNNSVLQQKLMRGRVLAQGFTIAILATGLLAPKISEKFHSTQASSSKS